MSTVTFVAGTKFTFSGYKFEPGNQVDPVAMKMSTYDLTTMFNQGFIRPGEANVPFEDVVGPHNKPVETKTEATPVKPTPKPAVVQEPATETEPTPELVKPAKAVPAKSAVPGSAVPDSKK